MVATRVLPEILLLAVLIAAMSPIAVGVASASPDAIHDAAASPAPSGPADDAAAKTAHKLWLRSVDTCECSVYAEFISRGPAGPSFEETEDLGGLSLTQRKRRFLRVTVFQLERSEWLVIDILKAGPADSRSALGSYKIGFDEIWALPREDAPAEFAAIDPDSMERITWLSPSSFVWRRYREAIKVEHASHREFVVTRMSIDE